MSERTELLSAARHAAALACDILRAGYRKRPAVHSKSSHIDLVTEYDRRSEECILQALAPWGIAVVGEEGGGSPAERVFYVDPLDGTTNFAHGHPLHCVSIGLVERGEPVLGVIHAPALGVEWWSCAGGGAFRNGERCQVSDTASLAQALLATGFPYDRQRTDDNNLREFAALKPHVRGVRRGGSAALDLAMLADGTFDGYWEMKLNPWDWAAGMSLVREAGGALSHYDGSPAQLRLQREGEPRTELLASNGALHQQLRDALHAAR